MPFAPLSERGVICPFQGNEGQCISPNRKILCEPHPREPECVKQAQFRARTLAVSFPLRSDLTALMAAPVDQRYDIIDALIPEFSMDQMDERIEDDARQLRVDSRLFYDGVINYTLEFIRNGQEYRQFGYKF